MFNVGGGEIIVILLLALLLLGPEKLPEMSRKVGRLLAEVRRMTSGFEEEIRSAIDIDLRDPLRSDAVHRTESGPTLSGPDDPSIPSTSAPTPPPTVPEHSTAFVADLADDEGAASA